jgi:phage terminase large subunit-like protein
LFQAVVAGTLIHDGDPRFATHVDNAVAKATPLGDLVSEDREGSPRKIDAAIAAIIALDCAAWHAAKCGNAPSGRRAVVL